MEGVGMADEMIDIPDSGGDAAGLEEAVSGLESQLDRAGAEPAPPPPPPPTQAQPAAPPRSERVTGFQRKFGQAGRRQQQLAELNRLKALEPEYKTRLEGNTKLLEELKEALKGLRPGGGEPEKPDPLLNPEEYEAWREKRLQAMLDERLKPVVEMTEAQRRAAEQEEQQTTQQQQFQAEQHAFLDELFEHGAAYEELAPEMAYGATDRVSSAREMLTAAFVETGMPAEAATARANLMFRAVAMGAKAEGRNMAAECDAFATGLVTSIARSFGLDIEPDAPGGEASGNGASYQPAPPPPPAAREIGRLNKVQGRAGAAGNAAPRLPARDVAPASELQTLARAGVTDMRALLRAALKDSGGNMYKAQAALGTLLPGQA